MTAQRSKRPHGLAHDTQLAGIHGNTHLFTTALGEEIVVLSLGMSNKHDALVWRGGMCQHSPLKVVRW